MSLTQTQIDVKNEIIRYGNDRGFSDEHIQLAVNVAFIESSLGLILANPDSTASGIFQYIDRTWNLHHAHLGSKPEQANQITAFYNDIQTYFGWYTNPSLNGNIPSDMSFEEYVYIKHHDGRAHTKFHDAPGRQLYTTKVNDDIVDILNISLASSAWHGGTGRLCVDSALYLGDGAAISEDPTGCIKYRNPDDPGSVYIDYALEAALTDFSIQNIIDADPVGAFYWCG